MREERQSIPYPEYQAITELMRAHYKAHEGQLRTIVAFGDLLTGDAVFDIDLLEVVEGWQGPGLAEFSSSMELPLRGLLRIYFLSPDEFERPALISEENRKQSTMSLLQRVRQGYEIILEDPPGYASRVLTITDARTMTLPPASGSVVGDHPLAFLQTGKRVGGH